MKKVLLIAAIACATFAHGEYLYWQVGSSVDTDVGGTWGGSGTYDTARIMAYTTDKSSAQAIGFTYNNYSLTSVETPMTSMAAVDLSALQGGASSYSFYIELSAYDSGNLQWKGDSKVVSYAELSNVSITSSLSDIAKVQAFTGSSYHVAPEPTSGMLLMVGFALLSLKRRKA